MSIDRVRGVHQGWWVRGRVYNRGGSGQGESHTAGMSEKQG